MYNQYLVTTHSVNGPDFAPYAHTCVYASDVESRTVSRKETTQNDLHPDLNSSPIDSSRMKFINTLDELLGECINNEYIKLTVRICVDWTSVPAPSAKVSRLIGLSSM